ncbi:MAG: hypothetical protein WCR63_00285 [Bacilli bacterium]
MIKIKKTSIGISLVVFLLGLLTAFGYFATLYFENNTAFILNDYISLTQTTVSNYLGMGSGSKYLLLIAVFSPAIFGFIGLFGRLGRFVNILSFGTFVFATVYFCMIRITSHLVLLSFVDGPGLWNSIIIMGLMLGTLLSLINLEKSK